METADHDVRKYNFKADPPSEVIFCLPRNMDLMKSMACSTVGNERKQVTEEGASQWDDLATVGEKTQSGFECGKRHHGG